MNKFIIGCAGWEYKDWKSVFYPKDIKNSEHLSYYSKYFNYTEINSTFYNLPSQDMVYGWLKKVPEDFKFTVKVWKEITHNYNDPELDSRIQEFFYRLEPLRGKIANFLLQFPPWFSYNKDHMDILTYILKMLPKNYKYMIELRDNSWYRDELLSKFIDNENLFLVTSYLKGIEPFYYQNQDSYYIRLIGDREIEKFNVIQRKQESTINELLMRIKKIQQKKSIKEIFIIVNNHFTGFAPETANRIKKTLGLPFEDFKKQRTLTDYL